MLRLFLSLGLLFPAASALAQTALDEYVAFDDGVFDYVEYDNDTGVGWTTRLFKMTSQRWRGDDDVDCERRLANSWLDACDLWQHELIMYIPETIRLGSIGGTEHTALLLISGGDNDGALRRSGNEYGGPLAVATNAVIVELRQVPNQPYFFDAEPGRERTEDEIIAYSIDRYFDEFDPTWPALAPMTKAAVRAMDAIQQFIDDRHDHEIRDFVVIGASKRGWTTWLTAAVDPRVKAILPASIDVHNLERQFEHHHSSYGFFARATADYVEANLACQFGEDTSGQLRELIDPAVYNDRYTMPKLVLNSAGDQFFVPDSTRFYYGDLPDPKQLRMSPNTDHSQSSDALVSALAWVLDAIDEDTPGQTVGWARGPGGSLSVTTDGSESAVYQWQAVNPDARDFRLETIGEAWVRTELTKNMSGEYVAEAPMPADGWAAHLIEVEFETIDIPGLDPVIESYTTDVVIVPNRLPFSPFDCSEPMQLAEGMWWDPATNGQGLDVNRFYDALVFGPWYLYDENGEAMWVTFNGELDGTRALGQLYEFTGPEFGPGFDVNYDPAEAVGEIVGTGTFAFLGTDHGVFHYTFGAQHGFVDGEMNVEEIDPRPDGSYAGHWWNPVQSGHGFQFNHKSNGVLFGTWYTYDESGDPTWYLFTGEMTDADSASAEVYAFDGSPLGLTPWQHELVQGGAVGNMSFEFSSNATADVDITVNGIDGKYSLVRITQ